MTKSAVARTSLGDSTEAGTFVGAEISRSLEGERPDALILFASSSYEYPRLLEAVHAACRPELLVGCSSAGEFTSEAHGERSISALALRSSDIRFSAGIGRRMREDRAAAARELVSSFEGLGRQDYAYRAALVLTDALAGEADDLVERLTALTAGSYQFFGGGAGDDARFRQTHVFCGTEAFPDATVALEMLSNKRLAVGVQHGWRPAGPPLRVTDAHGMRLVGLNGAPAVEAFEEHAEATGQTFDPTDPRPFFLHNVIGIDTGSEFKLRVPLSLEPDGSIECAAAVPVGAKVRIMRTSADDTATAAKTAVGAALAQLEDPPEVALFFDCAATRLRMGAAFGEEMAAVRRELGPTRYVGCNSYGQIARAEGQFSGFHNCTAVACLIPK